MFPIILRRAFLEQDRIVSSSVQFSSVWTFIFAHSYSKSCHECASGGSRGESIFTAVTNFSCPIRISTVAFWFRFYKIAAPSLYLGKSHGLDMPVDGLILTQKELDTAFQSHYFTAPCLYTSFPIIRSYKHLSIQTTGN